MTIPMSEKLNNNLAISLKLDIKTKKLSINLWEKVAKEIKSDKGFK